MEPLYKHAGVEERWQRTWEEEGLYDAEADDPREPFAICLPPPNVTDRLHMGHALNASVQDVLIRWHRMRDFNALWQPGYDHAGIALQAVMVKRLAGDGHVTIATVRPPTMLADVAVAVHPDDERYRELVGKEAIVPIAERRVPIIADERVDAEFGTGAVKITPGHDPVDWEIGRASCRERV